MPLCRTVRRPGETGSVQKSGLWWRFPLVTAVVFGVTAAGALAQVAVPGLLAVLERAPAGLHGEWWRLATALVVQDGGVFGTVSNLLFLALIGTAAEQVLSRTRWLVQYLGTGLAAELVGYAWQPVGAGNSVAVCGLTGGLAVALWRGPGRAPAWTVPVLLVWCAALVATLSPAATVPAIVAGAAAVVLSSAAVRRRIAVHRPVALTITAVGIVLSAATNIHGAALLIGVALGLPWLTPRAGAARSARRPRPWSAPSRRP